MKKLVLISLLLVAVVSRAQHTSCCSVNSITKANATLAMNESFAKAHVEPIPFLLESPKGEMVEFTTADGKKGRGYLIKAAQKSKKYLFIFHEWWGLNDYIKKEAEHFYGDLKDVNVLAIDLYDGNIATTREEAQKFVGEMTDARNRTIINGALVYAGKGAKVITLGWCMGGSWSLQTAIEGGKKVKGCVMYYGFPEMDVEKLKKLKTDVLGIFAEKDEHINVELVKSFEGKVKEAGKKIVVYNYVAGHAFANPSNPDYNKQATEDAYDTKVLPYLKKALKVK
ncbi:MAG: dienelactone hydrolase family protein [Bacteroidota bacterium]